MAVWTTKLSMRISNSADGIHHLDPPGWNKEMYIHGQTQDTISTGISARRPKSPAPAGGVWRDTKNVQYTSHKMADTTDKDEGVYRYDFQCDTSSPLPCLIIGDV